VQPTFKQFLAEAKNVHMAHVEDSILDQGIDGANKSLEYLEHVAHILKGNTNKKMKITVKYDGSPAIFCGQHPENGKFFVGTKGVFSKKEPKIIYTKADADKLYGDKPELANILKLAITHLPKLGIKGIVQGDLMFTHDMLKKHKYNDENYITFTPNTITYAVPENSAVAKQISKAKVGVIFHTTYTGKSMDNLSSSFNVNLNSFKRTPDVWFDDASYKDLTGTGTMTNAEMKSLESHMAAARKVLAKINQSKLKELTSKSTMKQLIHQHLNQMIRKGKHIDDPKQHAEDLIQFFIDRAEKQKGTAKEAEAERARDRQIKFAKDMKGILIQVFEFQSHVNAAKLAIIHKLEKAASMGTFTVDNETLVAAKQEGFVAVEHLTDKAIKLVDRLDFSQKNFMRAAR
jgi:hypothetical protein